MYPLPIAARQYNLHLTIEILNALKILKIFHKFDKYGYLT